MGKMVSTLFPNRRSIANDLVKELKEKSKSVADNTVGGDRNGYSRQSPQYRAGQLDSQVQGRLPGNVRQFVHDRWNGFGPQSIWDAQQFNKWLNKVTFQSIYNKGNRSFRLMRKHLDNGIWVNLVLAALSIAFLAVDGLYLLMRTIWTDQGGTGLAADLAATSLVLAGFFLLLSAACWGARELTVEIVKVRKRNATRLTA